MATLTTARARTCNRISIVTMSTVVKAGFYLSTDRSVSQTVTTWPCAVIIDFTTRCCHGEHANKMCGHRQRHRTWGSYPDTLLHAQHRCL